MKIAEIVATFPPYHGGMGYVCYHSARELGRRGHDVTVFTLDHGGATYGPDLAGFDVVRLKSPLIYGDGGIVPNLYSRLKGFDIAHLHYPFFGGAEYVYCASRSRGLPYFLTYHMDVCGTTFLKRLIIGAYEPLLKGRIVGRAGMVGALSFEHLRSSKAARFADWAKVVEMPNGVDSERFRPREKKRELVERYKLEGKTVVLFVGNLQPFKGLHLLIDVMTSLRDNGIVLLVVGGGYGESEYRKTVKSRGLQEKVIFAGPQAQELDLPFYYNLGDFLVLPSTHSESFGLVVLEAMASGLPAIVSSLPGPSQVVEEGRDGLIAKVGDAQDLKEKIVYLTREKEIRRNMGIAGREKVVKKYSWECVGERLEKILTEILKSRKEHEM
jgi:glycosyltransferase involved in cell wall biosynthesis